MVAGQTSRGINGKQNFLFPLPYMYISQFEGGDYSHLGTYSIDCLGWGENGRILNAPYYAPVDLRLVAKYGSTSPMLVYQSLEEVNYIDGTVDYITLGVAHDNNTPFYNIGRVVLQGELLGHTGTYGIATGDHVHIEIAKGTYQGFIQNEYGNYMFRNEYHTYLGFGVNNTVLYRPVIDLWREFSDTPVPTKLKKDKFPWALYSRKLRYKRQGY